MNYGSQQRSRAAQPKWSLETVGWPLCSNSKVVWAGTGISGFLCRRRKIKWYNTSLLLENHCISTGSNVTHTKQSCFFFFLFFFLTLCISNPKAYCYFLNIPISQLNTRWSFVPCVLGMPQQSLSVIGEDSSGVLFWLIKDGARRFTHLRGGAEKPKSSVSARTLIPDRRNKSTSSPTRTLPLKGTEKKM